MFKKYIIYFFLLLSFIYSYICLNNENIVYSDEKVLTGYVTYYYKKDDKSIFYLQSDELVLCTFYGDVSFNLGDYISIEGDISTPTSNTVFNMFNYKDYLRYEGIYHTFLVNSYNIISSNKKVRYKIKNIIINRINSISFNSYLYTFILGNNKYIDSDVLSSYRTNGISHLFSISGMHISLITLLLLKMLDKSKFKYFIVFIFLIFYMFLTDYSPSVIRSSLLFILITLNKKLKLNISMIDLMILLLSLCIFIDPFIIYKIGFKYSYIITFFLIYFNKLISRNNSYIKKSLVISFISFLVSMPITINNFYEVNFLGIILNLIFVPLVSFLIFPFSLVTFIFPNSLFVYLTNTLEKLSIFFSNINIFIINLSKMNAVGIIIYYLVIIFVLKMIEKRKYKYIIIFLFLIIIHKNINYLNPYLKVVYFDVKQADEILIMMPHNKYNILIDTGNYDDELTIISYLKSKGISSLSNLIISHGDADHIGNAINIVNNFKVDNVIFNCGELNSNELNLINALEEKSIKYDMCINSLKLDNYEMLFLNTWDYNDENSNSSVIYFYYNDFKFLFMADASIEREMDILKKYELNNIDFLKVGHHGSDTSSSKEFINSINPKYSIISVGKNNSYGHPKKSVLDVLNNSVIYRTDIDGSIEVKIKSDGYSIETCIP